MTLLEMTLKAPGFKAYCRRRINGKSTTHAQRYAAACKAEQSKIRAFMKRRGPWSMLKEPEYSTGAGASHEPIRARLFYKAGEFNSEILNPAPVDIYAEEPAELVDMPAEACKSWVPLSDDAVPLCEECGAPVQTTETGFTQLVCDSCYSKPAVNY